jgi:dihydroorotase
MRDKIIAFLFPLMLVTPAPGQVVYDLLLKGGHVIDPKNHIDGVRDVAVAGGKIALVASNIPASKAYKTVNVSPFYVTPGLVDIHVHVFACCRPPVGHEALSVYPDSHTLRSGVTTVVDAGTSGWRNFDELKRNVIDASETRVLAWLNIVGQGMADEPGQQKITDMDPKAAADLVKRYRDTIVGIKTAHYGGPEWVAVERAVEAGMLADVPVMVDFGTFRPERPFQDLVLHKLRSGDIYTHTYLVAVPMLDEHGKVLPYLFEARKRGVLFDVGHGQGSFLFRQAVPAVRQGFMADSISTDLHTGSMNAGMKDMLNVMSKFLNVGVPLADVVLRSTWNPAKEIHRADLGHLSPGAPADIAVLRVEKGDFGFVDVFKAQMSGTERLACELTVRGGKVVYELNGITRQPWNRLGNYPSQGDERWEATHEDPKPKP